MNEQGWLEKMGIDDKVMVITGTVILAILSMFMYGAESNTIVGNIVTGLFGIAVGKNL